MEKKPKIWTDESNISLYTQEMEPQFQETQVWDNIISDEDLGKITDEYFDYGLDCVRSIFFRRDEVYEASDDIELLIHDILTKLGDNTNVVEYWRRKYWQGVPAHRDCMELLNHQRNLWYSPATGFILYLSTPKHEISTTQIIHKNYMERIPVKKNRLVRFKGCLPHYVPEVEDILTGDEIIKVYERRVILFNTWPQLSIGKRFFDNNKNSIHPVTKTPLPELMQIGPQSTGLFRLGVWKSRPQQEWVPLEFQEVKGKWKKLKIALMRERKTFLELRRQWDASLYLEDHFPSRTPIEISDRMFYNYYL